MTKATADDLDRITAEAPTITVDRGQPVIVTAFFASDPEPDEIDFSFTKPDEARPHVDDGFGQPQSRIERLDKGVYRYVISTKGFKAGDGAFKFAAEWDKPRLEGYRDVVIRGTYVVRDAPGSLP